MRSNIFWGTADYSVGDTTATHVRGLGLSSKYSLFMSSPTIGHGVADLVQKTCFLGVKKGVLGPFSLIFAHLSAKQHFKAKTTLFGP